MLSDKEEEDYILILKLGPSRKLDENKSKDEYKIFYIFNL